MQTTAAIPGRAPKRLTGLFFAILLQIGLIWALVVGLDVKVWPTPLIPPLKVTLVPTDHPVEPPPPPEGPLIEPKQVEATLPKIIFETGDDNGGAIHVASGDHGAAGPADHGPLSIQATHTIPPYPAPEQRLGVEGTVVLRLTISAEGVVTDAVVVGTSGDEGLDRAARQWVMAHWRYQPAIRGGAAVPATATVGVRFNLRQAG